MRFSIDHTSAECRARAGQLTLAGQCIHTPVFMPVGTAGAVKGVSAADLETIRYGLILGNAYHLYLRPGLEVLTRAGGLAGLSGWERGLLTDSGGFQVFSLAKLRKISDEGVAFRSHIDGSAHLLTPELSMDIQATVGSHIMMAFDECAAFPCGRDRAREAMDRTTAWLGRCRDHVERIRAGRPDLDTSDRANLFGIVQGVCFDDLRLEHLQTVESFDLPGIAIGGLSVGEGPGEMYRVLRLLKDRYTREKTPRYLMGVGTPQDILMAVECGIDMFDCVLPTRDARHGTCFTADGRLDVTKARHKTDLTPIDPECDCAVCRRYSRAYLRHLFNAREMLGPMLTTYHNLHWMKRFMERIREAVMEDRFLSFTSSFLTRYKVK